MRSFPDTDIDPKFLIRCNGLTTWVPDFLLQRVIQGGGGGGVPLVRFTNGKRRITDIKISFSRITKISK